MTEYTIDLSIIDFDHLKEFLGREIKTEEAFEIMHMVKEHINDYILECLVSNSGIITKLTLWQKVENILNRTLTVSERKVVSKYIPRFYYNSNLKIEDTPLMDIIDTWM
jgi:hypothetical protein|uniref:Uncharacterized protein n=1 Tax=viral metagenome TaxID=1070528 RepID=A0A6C0M223_9ZZZZ